jgi:hypothetical protein
MMGRMVFIKDGKKRSLNKMSECKFPECDCPTNCFNKLCKHGEDILPRPRWVYAVVVCDYESCWPVRHFHNEEHAEQYHKNYKLKNNEQKKFVQKYRVF